MSSQFGTEHVKYVFLLGSPLRPALLLGFVVLMLQTVATHLVYYDKMFVVSNLRLKGTEHFG